MRLAGSHLTIGEVIDDLGVRGNRPLSPKRVQQVPGGPSYPAEYFTGPLGINNILPTQDGAFFMTWLNVPGGSMAQHRAKILTREDDMARLYDGIMFPDFQAEWGEGTMQWIHDHGSIPIVAGLAWGDVNVVAAGGQDASIDAYAAHYAALGFPIIVRLMHEMDQPTAYSMIGKEANFRAAWQRIVTRFDAAGATNVGFWWCPTEGGPRPAIGSALSYYPGHQYVDWVGSDGYNWTLVGETDPPQAGYQAKYGSPYDPGSIPFNLTFDHPLGFANLITKHNQYGPFKPFMIGETGSTWDPAVVLEKRDWFESIRPAMNSMEFCRGISFFDVDASAESAGDYRYPQRNNWIEDRLAAHPEIYAAFIALSADSYFNTRT
jgi:hypothetical protein